MFDGALPDSPFFGNVSVSEFAKKTGDYRSLSAVDIKVIALVYDLEKEHVGTEHIKTQPDRKVTLQDRKRTECKLHCTLLCEPSTLYWCIPVSMNKHFGEKAAF